MAIRKPGRYTNQWYFDDVLEYEDREIAGDFPVYDPDRFIPLYTYIEDFPLVTADYAKGLYSKQADNSVYTQFRSLKVKYFEEPPQRASETFNNEVGSIEYEVQGKLITIVAWQNYGWRDEWPIRLALNYLCNCLYRPGHQFVFRVVKDPIAFWQSERFLPVTGHYGEYLERTPQWVP